VTIDDMQEQMEKLPIDRAQMAYAASHSRAKGNRAIRGVSRHLWQGVPIVTHYTIRIDQKRKPVKEGK
jgi:hypothetical protein